MKVNYKLTVLFTGSSIGIRKEKIMCGLGFLALTINFTQKSALSRLEQSITCIKNKLMWKGTYIEVRMHWDCDTDT